MHKNRAENFAGQKRAKTAKRTRFSQKKAKPGAFWVLERKTAVKASCGQMRGGNTGCNIRRELVDRVRTSIGTKKPQALRFSRGLGTSGLCFLSKNDALGQKEGEKPRFYAAFP